LIETLIDIGTPAGVGLFVYYLLHKEIDSLKDCISSKHLTNSRDIQNIKGRLGIE